MAVNHVKLQKDYDYMRNSRDSYRDWYETEKRKNTALKGVITKLKNKMKAQLKEDIVSNVKNKVRYGDAGEILKVLADKGTAFILKGKRENFPVSKDKVTVIE